ncbi:hypothetical protein H6P81_019274 [Aristolochia fimbriata]|uniref:Uncharacterized protein n=1 Tax=Aristolochia fimbriata TaxID=158543 RepID=A0AAV7DS53_ARIFI|nr:hypothetical protein H6P81_019274 [Aristolochia fimbriata]
MPKPENVHMMKYREKRAYQLLEQGARDTEKCALLRATLLQHLNRHCRELFLCWSTPFAVFIQHSFYPSRNSARPRKRNSIRNSPTIQSKRKKKTYALILLVSNVLPSQASSTPSTEKVHGSPGSILRSNHGCIFPRENAQTQTVLPGENRATSKSGGKAVIKAATTHCRVIVTKWALDAFISYSRLQTAESRSAAPFLYYFKLGRNWIWAFGPYIRLLIIF